MQNPSFGCEEMDVFERKGHQERNIRAPCLGLEDLSSIFTSDRAFLTQCEQFTFSCTASALGKLDYSWTELLEGYIILGGVLIHGTLWLQNTGLSRSEWQKGASFFWSITFPCMAEWILVTWRFEQYYVKAKIRRKKRNILSRELFWDLIPLANKINCGM